jgi:ribosomal-protein-alanine N-acetyltransferase
MQLNHITTNLSLSPLSLNDADFIKTLVNTENWIKFIGQRNINSISDSEVYIKKILDNKNIQYWIVKLIGERQAIGIITLIKREYLEFHDLGFAFLPYYSGKGYGFEASACVLNDLLTNTKHRTILATTLKENISSIKLLQKLGFKYKEEIQNENDNLQVYSISTNNIK